MFCFQELVFVEGVKADVDEGGMGQFQQCGFDGFVEGCVIAVAGIDWGAVEGKLFLPFLYTGEGLHQRISLLL